MSCTEAVLGWVWFYAVLCDEAAVEDEGVCDCETGSIGRHWICCMGVRVLGLS
jgi:hypothetical protein